MRWEWGEGYTRGGEEASLEHRSPQIHPSLLSQLKAHLATHTFV